MNPQGSEAVLHLQLTDPGGNPVVHDVETAELLVSTNDLPAQGFEIIEVDVTGNTEYDGDDYACVASAETPTGSNTDRMWEKIAQLKLLKSLIRIWLNKSWCMRGVSLCRVHFERGRDVYSTAVA